MSRFSRSGSPALLTRLVRLVFKTLGLTRDAWFVRGIKLGHGSAEDGGKFILDSLLSSKPVLFGRLGTPESNSCLNKFEIDRHHSPALLHRLSADFFDLRREWDRNVWKTLETNVGFFPANQTNVERFVSHYTSQLRMVDALAYWGWVPGESLLIRQHCPGARLFEALALEPYLLEDPWTRALEGKRVLVIHPFKESILAQYKKRDVLFENPSILPPFDLRVIPAVQSLAGNRTPFGSWFEALDWMKTQMEIEPFDVCLVGAGSYGLPLCAHAKKLGASGIQIGGGLQILFGIIGKRWESMPHISRFFNSHWIRPAESERIESGSQIEGGCYW